MRLYDYPGSGNCYKVRLLLALLARDYERVTIDIFAGETLTDAYGALNPLRETPVLELDSGERIAQSPAILWYLAEGTPFLPDDRVGARARAPVARVRAGARDGRDRRAALPAADRPAADRGPAGDRGGRARAARRPSRATATGSWASGCTIADVAVFGYGHVAGQAGLAPGPHVRAWFERIRALPGFVADLAPYGENARPGAGRSIYG